MIKRKLHIEQLENRIVPATYLWKETQIANFTSAAAWWNMSTNTAAANAPQNGDTIIFSDTNYSQHAGNGDCVIDASIELNSLIIHAGYSGEIEFDAFIHIDLNSNQSSTINGGDIRGAVNGNGIATSGIILTNNHTLIAGAGASLGGTSQKLNIDIGHGAITLKNNAYVAANIAVGNDIGANDSALNIETENNNSPTFANESTIIVYSDGNLNMNYTEDVNSAGHIYISIEDTGTINCDVGNEAEIDAYLKINNGKMNIEEDSTFTLTKSGGLFNLSLESINNSTIYMENNSKLIADYGAYIDDSALDINGDVELETKIGNRRSYYFHESEINLNYLSTASGRELIVNGDLILNNTQVNMSYNIENVNSSDIIIANQLNQNNGGTITIIHNSFINFDEIGTVPVANQNHTIMTANRGIRGTFNIQATQGMIINFPAAGANTNELKMRRINEVQPGMVGGQVWLDADENGEFNVDEEFLNDDVVVKLHDSTDGSVIDTYVSTVGRYYFENITPGSYYISFDYSNNYQPMNFTTSNATGVEEEIDSDVTTDLSNSDIYRVYGKTNNIAIGSTDYINTVNIGVVVDPMTSTISGTVWNDENEDGIQNDSNVYSGIQVELRDYLGNLIATTYTDAYGNYNFSNIGANSYYIRVNYSGYGLTLANQTTDDLDSDFIDVDGTWASTGTFTIGNDEELDFDCGLFSELEDEIAPPPPGP